MPPQYTPGLMVSVFFEEKLCLSHPENDGYDESAYGAAAGVAPVLISSVVVIFDVSDTLPTTFTESAESVPPPFSVSADELLELSIRLQPLRLTADVPFMTVAPLAVVFRLSTQPRPPLPTATARAEIVS